MSIRSSLSAYMRHAWANVHKPDVVFVLVVFVASFILTLLPTGYEKTADRSVRARAVVLETWNDMVHNYGIVMQGEQIVSVRVLNGPYKGLEADANNILYGKADLDKIFHVGDKALVVIDPAEASSAPPVLTVLDHYRLDLEIGLVVLFFFLLILYGGWTGLRSALSFVFAVLAVWKVLVPAFLRGSPPVLTSLGIVGLLSFTIIFLVAGLTRTGVAAFLGTLLGTLASAVLALITSIPYRLNGAVMPFSETLRFGGFDHLNLTQIFLAGTLLASSGAFMDLAIDIAAAMEEVHKKRPGLSFLELTASGLVVGRKVTGTMFTTLLLAYTGGYTSQLMVFIAQGIPMGNMFNLSYISSEVFHTLMGSIGLVLIAPFTAITTAAFFVRAPLPASASANALLKGSSAETTNLYESL